MKDEYYQDTRYCYHCNKNTVHKCKDSSHERDSTNDFQECDECKWWTTGLSGCRDYNRPFTEL